MDKKPIILIIVNIILSIALGVLAYFTYGFRGTNAIDIIGDTYMEDSSFYVGDLALNEDVVLPNKENLEIRFGTNSSIKISINTKASISFKKNDKICGLEDINVTDALGVKIGDNFVQLNTERKTLTLLLKELFPEDNITEVIETNEDWLFCLLLTSNGKTITKEIYDVGVDIGPVSVELNVGEIIL